MFMAYRLWIIIVFGGLFMGLGAAWTMAERGFEFNIADGHTHFGCMDSTYARRLSEANYKGVLLEMIRDAGLWFSPAWRKHYKQCQQKNVALMETILSISGARMIVDSSKTAVRLKYLLRNRDIEIKVIRLIRDGRAVALTYMDPEEFADAKDPSLRGGGSGGNLPKRCWPSTC